MAVSLEGVLNCAYSDNVSANAKKTTEQYNTTNKPKYVSEIFESIYLIWLHTQL